jgi:lipid-binding SYLF domain-containing protein
MKRATLEDLYARHPETKAKIENSVGYGVFSDFGVSVLLLGFDHGYGVVTDKASGKETYVKMADGTLGLGLGADSFRMVTIYNDRAALDHVLNNGWGFGGKAGASAKLKDSGGSAHAVGSFTNAVEVYQFSKGGLWARACVGVVKAWPDKELNE